MASPGNFLLWSIKIKTRPKFNQALIGFAFRQPAWKDSTITTTKKNDIAPFERTYNFGRDNWTNF